MKDMLLLRPPPRALLERGPPASVRDALRSLGEVEEHTVIYAVQNALEDAPFPFMSKIPKG